MKKTLHILCFLLFSFLHGQEKKENFPEIPFDFAFSQLEAKQSVTFNHYCWSCFTGASERWVFQFDRSNEGLNYTIWESPSKRIEDYQEDIHPNKVLLGTGSIDQQQLIKLDKFMILSRDGDKCDSQCWSEIKIKRNNKELFGLFHDIKYQNTNDNSVISFSDLIRSFKPNKNDGFYFDRRPIYTNIIHEETVSDWKKIQKLLDKISLIRDEMTKILVEDDSENQEDRIIFFGKGFGSWETKELVLMINGYLSEIEDIEKSNVEILFESIEFASSRIVRSEEYRRCKKLEDQFQNESLKEKFSEVLPILKSIEEIAKNYEHITWDYKE